MFTRTTVRHRVSRGKAAPEAAREALSWAAEHRGKPAYSPAPSAGIAAARLIKPLSKGFGPAASELDRLWPEIVGEQLAQWTRPEKLQGGSGGTTLVIKARGPAAALIEAQSARILDRVGQYAGRRPDRLKVIQGQMASPASRPMARPPRVIRAAHARPVPTSPDERLRLLLDSWGEAVSQREGIALPKANTDTENR